MRIERTTHRVHDHHFPEGPCKESRVSTAAKVDAGWDLESNIDSDFGNNIISSYHPRVGNNTCIAWVHEFPQNSTMKPSLPRVMQGPQDPERAC